MTDDPSTRHVLLVCANPSGSSRIRVDREERVLREAIQLSPYRDKLVVTSLQAATIDDLHRALLREQFDVVHFSGHGTNRGLVFEDAEGRIFVPSAEALGRLFGRYHVSAVLLNACYSLTVGRLAALDVDFTIASAHPIDDLAAIEFSRGFYDALGSGHSVLDAFEAGEIRTKLKNLDASLVLLKRGETFEAGKGPQADLRKKRGGASRGEDEQAVTALLGIAIDTSGSMQTSIRNSHNIELSRWDGVSDALQSVWRNMQSELTNRKSSGLLQNENVRIFAYLFGTRIGQFIDLLSLLKAAKDFDIEAEVASLRRSYEAKARNAQVQYGGYADLARRMGYGNIVDGIVESAQARAKNQIVAELAQRIKSRADNLGDVTATIAELCDLWGEGDNPVGADLRELLFGDTPMCTVLREAKQRFERTPPASQDEVRVLLLISDGMPTDGNPTDLTEQIQSQGVCVVTCFVSADDVAEPYVLYANEQSEWSDEARLMFRSASSIDAQGVVANELLSRGWHIEPGAKLFVQVNHSELFREFVDAVTNAFVSQKEGLLPAGR